MAEASKYFYKNKMMTAKQLSSLPRCQVSLSHLINNLNKGIPAEQAILKKVIKKLPFNGGLYSVFELSKFPECVVERPCLNSRIYSGWEVEKAMTTPKNIRLSHKNNSTPEPRRVFQAPRKKPATISKKRALEIMAVPMKPTSTYSYWFKERMRKGELL